MKTYPKLSAPPAVPEVGSRELKTRLGTYLRQVRAGARFVVTDRGRPVAELRPISSETEDLDAALENLVARGIIGGGELRERPRLSDFEPIPVRGPAVSQTLLDDREDRF